MQTLEGREMPAAFTPGNLVVYRVGDGSGTLSNAANPVFLDEYTTGGALVQSVALPTSDNGANQALTASGSATSEGQLTRSANEQYLIVTGYDAPVGTLSVSTTPSGSVLRVIGRVSASSAIDTTTTTTSFSGTNIRSAATTNGTDIWVAGGNTGVIHTTFGAADPGTIVSTTQTNNRVIQIVGGQLYVSTQAGTDANRGVNTVGAGTPTTSGATMTRLPGLTDTSNPSTYGYFFADLDAVVSGVDTLYIADDGDGAFAKFSLVSGSWVSNGKIGATADDYRGITGVVNGSAVTLYLTKDNGTGSDTLVTLVDSSGYNGALTGTPAVIATAATDTAFRGITPTPIAPNASPVNTLPTTFAVNEDTQTLFAGVFVADPDAGSANISVTLSVPSGKGTLNVKEDVGGGVIASEITGNGTNLVVITSSQSKINATLADANGLKYTPGANESGDVTLTMVTNDLGNTGSGGPKTDTDTSTISISALNDPPTVTIASDFTTNEDQQTSLNGIAVADVDSAAANVIVTLSIPAGAGSLTVNDAVTGGVTAAQISLNNSDTVTITAPITAISATLADAMGVIFAPAPESSGDITLTVGINDQGNTGTGGAGTASDTATISVAAVNDGPINTVPGSVITDEDTPFAFTGIDEVSIDDIDVAAASLQVTLTPVDGSVELGDSTGLMVSGAGTNASPLVATGSLADLNAALTTLVFTPSQDFFGLASLTVKTNDLGNTGLGGALEATDAIDVEVTAINDAPQLSDYQFFIPGNIADGTEVNPSDPLTPSDVDSASFTFAITDGDPDGHFSIDSNGVIKVDNNSGLGGEYVLEVTVTDDDPMDPQSGVGFVTISINTPPFSNGIDDQTVNEDEGAPNVPIVIDLGAAFDDAEQPDDQLTYTVESTWSSDLLEEVEISGTTLTITPAVDAFGEETFTIRATDGAGEFAEATFAVTVNPVNDAPTLDPIGDVEIDEDSGEQMVELTGILVGPDNEAVDGQTIFNVTATSDAPGLIPSVVPVVYDPNTDSYSLRFTPIANANGTTEITVTVTDDGGTDNGGIDTFVQKFTVTVDPLADAPILDPFLIPVLPQVKLRTTPIGAPVSDLLANVNEVDGEPLGIAVVGFEDKNIKGKVIGVWEYSTDGGVNWLAIPVVSTDNAFLLSDNPNTRVRFRPNLGFTGYMSIRFKAWDQSSIEGEEEFADTTLGDPSYSDKVERAWVYVGNAIPKVDSNGAILKPVREDSANSSTILVKNVLGLAANEGLPKKNLGIAITSASTADGKWQYRLTRTKLWIDVGPVSESSALLLKPTDSLRFIPNANADGRGTIEFKTWDGAAFSIDGGSAWMDITPELELSAAAVLDSIDVNGTTAPVTFASFMSPMDIDGGDVGVAIIGTRGVHGTWSYSTDGGATWFAVGVVTPGKALFLNPDAMIKFAPDSGLVGTAGLSFKAWNDTKNSVGTRGVANLLNTSKNTELLTVAVGNVAPVLDTNPDVVLPVVKVTLKPSAGAPVSKLLGVGVVNDASKGLKGVAVVGVQDNGNGKWQYSVGGGIWIDFGVVSADSAVLLTTVNRIRFVPNPGTAAGETATIEFKAWDGTAGVAGDRINSGNPNLNSFSDEIETATITVIA